MDVPRSQRTPMGNPEEKPCRVGKKIPKNPIREHDNCRGYTPNCPLILLGGGVDPNYNPNPQKKLVYNGNINKGLLAKDVLIVFPQAYPQNH